MSKIDKPMISIIMSVYNADKYLLESLNSIYKSTYKKFEVICINDGSTDTSEDICLEFKATYKNFYYYSQKNKGLSYSRNKGVKLSSGKYITFIDADDIIDSSLLNYLIELLEKYNADIAYTELLVFSNRYNVHSTIEKPKEKVYKSEEAIKKYFISKAGNVCGGLFKKDLFYNVKFPNGLIYEDNVAKTRLLLNAKKIVFSDSKLYLYRKTFNGITQKKIGIKNLDILKIGYIQERQLISCGGKVYENLQKEHLSMISDTTYHILEKLIINKHTNWNDVKKIVPIPYLFKILFFGLKEKTFLRFRIFLKVIKNIIILPRYKNNNFNLEENK